MAKCTAEKTGQHVEGSDAQRNCPACGTRATVATAPRKIESFADLRPGDTVFVELSATGRKDTVKKASVEKVTKTLIKVQGLEGGFKIGDGYERGGGHFPSRIMLPDRESRTRYSLSRRNAYTQASESDLREAMNYRPEGERFHVSALGEWRAEQVSLVARATARARTALTLNAQSATDMLTPRVAEGKPYPYTDEDVVAVSGTVTNAVAPLVSALKDDYRAGMIRAFLPPTSKGELQSLLSVVGMIREDEDLVDRQTAEDVDDALVHQLMRLQGYEQKIR